MLTILLGSLLVGCGGDPVVSVTASSLDGGDVPKSIDETIEKTLQPGALGCYEDALAGGDLSGVVEVHVTGSHGILKVEPASGPSSLRGCATGKLNESRVQRQLGDGPTQVGFKLRFDFGAE